MGIIKAVKLAFDYLKYDEDGNVQETQRAVDGVDIDIKEGQFVAILGHNGSGKSTFAKHINALLLPSDGTIWIDGINTSEEPELWKVRQKAGMVFQNPDNQIIGTLRINFPEVRSSELLSQESWRCVRNALSWMSRQPCWTRTAVRKYSQLFIS